MRSLLFSFGGRVVACCAGTWIINSTLRGVVDDKAASVPITIVLSSVLWSLSFAKYVVPALSAFKNRAKYDALAPLSGIHYAFDNRRVRLYLLAGVIWVAADDVAAIVAPAPDARDMRLLGADYGPIPERPLQGYTEAGLLRLMTTRNAVRKPSHDMVRFKHWLETEAFPNLRRLPSSSC
ncbi:hypothetical protein [Massilia sp. CF038]|uniref:hypothetical protein n=1 Tax=Massilia sp. CF038 TaxID=1881045 RepID=UPI0009126037|nr:hypothetical protein [Massilia sp. CF038]SHH54275.1 hypothetical protein SAMN05428948_4375 [Massilia sp. CF038]